MTNAAPKIPLARWPKNRKFLASITLGFALGHLTDAAAMAGAKEMDAYFKPFAATNNLSGFILIERGDTKRGDTVLFSKGYGFADRGKKISNRANTRFHIASMSILFTSTAVLRLIDQGKLSFDTHVSDIVPGIPNGDKITIRNLLEQDSNLPDANDDLPNYDDLLNSHQTPQSLIDQIKHLPTHGDPGGESQREEHSGQNLLALIIEKETGLPFAQAMKAEVFDPFGMHDSGIDDDSPIGGAVAQGYQVNGTFGLKPAPTIHWSALPGNGSAYTTISDEWKWLRGVVHGKLLSESSRKAMLEARQGYGWDQASKSERLGEMVFLANGRVTGFSSIMEYLPNEDIAVIALTNIEHDANPSIIPEATALLMGKSYQAFDYHTVPPAVVGHPSGDFVFGPDFYRPSATLRVVSDANGVTLIWPQRDAPLLPIGKDKFMDRFYWSKTTIIRGADGEPSALEFGKFRGTVKATPAAK
jgi:D-alanyl-D-alanine carboxypeptidase